jgi:hypothetical protein
MNLTPAQQERLAILIEEAAEVIQVGGKILRHGYFATDSDRMLYDNKSDLAKEVGQLQHAIRMILRAEDIDEKVALTSFHEKAHSIKKYLHHPESALT